MHHCCVNQLHILHVRKAAFHNSSGWLMPFHADMPHRRQTYGIGSYPQGAQTIEQPHCKGAGEVIGLNDVVPDLAVGCHAPDGG